VSAESPRRGIRRQAIGPAILLLIVSTAALVAWDVLPNQLLTIIRLYLFATAGLAVWLLLQALAAAHPRWHRTEFDDLFKRTSSTNAVPEEFEHIRRAISLSEFSGIDAHTRLKPLLRNIVDAHLVARYGRGLEVGAEQARDWLGAQAWEAVRPGELPPRDAPGMNQQDIENVVVALEELSRS
jgi:hypothetical protein